MAEGTKTWEGGGVPLLGESQIIQQTAATDIITITGATSQSGDFLVMQNSTGTEKAYITSAGLGYFAGGLSMGSSVTGTQAQFVVSATTMQAGVLVNVTSTGAIAAGGGGGANGFLVSISATASAANAAYAYSNTSEGSCVSLLGVYGSKAPTYFLQLNGSGGGGWVDNGFVDTGLFLVSALATTVPITAIKIAFGDSVLYIPCLTTTSLAAS